MKRSDAQLNRLLAGRDQLSQADKDEVFDQVLAHLPEEAPAKRPLFSLGWLRLAMAAAALLLAIPAGYLLLSRPPADQFTARGPADVSARFAVLCARDLAPGRCPRGEKLLFRVEPARARFFAALAKGGDGSVIWYFTGVSLADLPGDGLLGLGVPVGPEHTAGRYEVVGVFSERALGKDELRALLDAPQLPAGVQLARSALEVAP